jgi:autotransporter-associated beta strand protein
MKSAPTRLMPERAVPLWHSTIRRLIAALSTAWIAVTLSQTHAATFTWDGGGTDGNWSTDANWNPDAKPGATGNILVFAGGANLNTVNDQVTALATTGTAITFDAGAGSFNLGGNALTVGSGGGAGQVIVQQNSANPQIISLNLNFSGGNGDRSIVFGTGAGSLTLSGNINFGTGGNGDWLFPTTAAGTIVLSGNNTGDGKGSNALTAGTNVMKAMMRNNVAGTNLILGSNTALGNVGSGDAAAGTASFRGVIANQQLNLSTSGGNRSLPGSSLIINANNINYNGSSNLTLANIISHAGNRDFVVSSSGSVTLTGGIFLSGDQTGRQLYVNLSGTGGMTVNGAVADTFHSGGLTTGTSTLRKASGGTLRLNGDSSYTALTQVDAGVLLVNGAHSPTANSQRYTIASTATLGGNGTIKPYDTTASLTGLTVSGTLSPGDPLVNNGLGTLTLDGTNSARGLLALETGSKVQIDLMTDIGGGRLSDKVAILGASGSNDVYFNSTVVNFSDPTGILPAGNYILFSANAANAFSGTPTVGTGLDIYSSKTIGSSGNNIVLALGAPNAPVSAPPVPSGLAATAPAPNQVVLNWSHSYRAISYTVRRRTESGPFSVIATVTAPAITYTDTTGIPGTVYYYAIAANNAAGTSADTAEVAGASYEPRGIGINLKPAASSGMAAGDFAGAVRLSHWNNLTGPTGYADVKSISNPLDNTGAVVGGMNVSVTGGNSGSGTFLLAPGETGNEASLFNSVFDQFDGAASTITASGIPYGSYDVYLYMRDDGSSRGGSFTIGGTTYYVRGGAGNPAGTGTGYVLSSATTHSGSTTPQGNYVRFSGLTGSSFSCSFTAFNAGDSVQRLKFPGFQIVSAAPVTTIPPGVPSGVKITATSLSAVTLSWNASNAAAEYLIFRSATSGVFDYNNPLATVAATNTSYSDTTAVEGTTYYYIIRARNIVGSSTDSTQLSTPPPNLDSVTASSLVIWPGQSTTFTWAIPNAASLTINDGSGAQSYPVSGSLPVTLNNTTTFTFTATNAHGQTIKPVQITVVPKPNTREALWQWSIPITGIVSGETNDNPRAFLYIPPNVKTVRGVIIGQHNMLEEPILEHSAVRQGLADAAMAAIWVSPAFDGSFNFTANPTTPALFQQMMDALAAESGYAELSKTPVVWIGHSAMAEAPYFFAAWDTQHSLASGEPKRCAAAISVKGWYPGKHDSTTPTYANSDLAGVPIMYVEGEYADANGRAAGALAFLNGTAGSIVSFLADVGGGHFDWNDSICQYLGMYLRKLGQYRLPATAAPDGTATLQTINPATQGWSADRWRKGQNPAANPAAVGAYSGNTSEAFWYFDQEHAESTHNKYLPVKTQYQLLGYTQNGALIAQQETHLQVHIPFNPELTGDGLTFKLGTTFLDTVPAVSSRLTGWSGLPVGAAIGHASGGGPITLERICGPVEQLSPDTFRINFDRVGTNNIYGQNRSRDICLMAVHPGDSTYVRAVQQSLLRISLPLTSGNAQTITFPAIADQPVGTPSIPLNATTTGTSTYPGAKVGFYVREGPAKVNGDTLEFTQLPPRTKFPVKVTVVATQYGRTIAPLLQTAAPVTRTFHITATALQQWRQDHFENYQNSGDGADDADPDHDERNNLLEYATGTDPLSANAGSVQTLGRTVDQSTLTLTFTRIADSALTYIVEGSETLAPGGWSPIWSSTGGANMAGSVTVADIQPISSEAKRFLRLRVRS